MALMAAACGDPTRPRGSAQPRADGGPASATGEGRGPVGAGADAATTFEGVRLADRAVTIDAAAVRSGLRGDDGTVFRFAVGTPGIDKLGAGSVALFADRAVRRVAAVRARGDEVVVDTTAAKLNDLVRDGTVGFSAPVRWGDIPRATFREAAARTGLSARGDLSARTGRSARGDPSARAGLSGRAVVTAAYEPGGEMSFSGKLQGFDVNLKLEPTAGRLGFEMEAKRANARLTAKGSISNFIQEVRFRYEHGENTLVQANVLGLKGDAEVTWAAVGHGSPGLDTKVVRIKLPFEVPIPISVAGIPFVLKVSSAMRFVPAMTKDSSSGGSWKLSYHSDHGFKQAAALPAGSAKLHGATAGLGSVKTVTAGYVPVGIGYGWEFPRLELGIAGLGTFAGLSLDSYASGEWTPGTTLTSDIPPCQKASVELKAVALLKLDLLGIVKYSQQTTLWKRKWEKFRNDKPCTLTGTPPVP
jgi:hypothetical protein